MAPSFRFQVIGAFAAWRDGERLPDAAVGSRKGRTLLKVLLLHRSVPVPADRLCEILWPEGAPANAERSLASLASRLRALLGAEAVAGALGTYRLLPGPALTADLWEAEDLAREARRRLGRGEAALALADARAAADLVGSGTVLADDARADWVEPSRAALTTLRRDVRRCGWEAALLLGEVDAAAALADAALGDDPLDEEACRALLRAHQRSGRPADGLRAFERLRRALADELGIDPSPATRALQLALLREEPGEVAHDVAPGLFSTGRAPPPAGGVWPAAPPPPAPLGSAPPAPARPDAADTGGSDPGFVGRGPELARLRRAWADATRGRSGLILLAGEAGIGKTRLAEELAAEVQLAGAVTARARCYAAERSLPLAPLVDALGALGATWPTDALRAAAGSWAGVLGDLVPALALDALPPDRSTPQVERQRTSAALTVFLDRLSAQRPTLLLLDDLHHAGASTAELLHHLQRRAPAARLLVVATVRVEEGDAVLRELADVAERVDLGPLPDEAVAALARRMGLAAVASEVVSATRGHTLTVVELLHALAHADEDAVPGRAPASLNAAVLQRVAHAGPAVEELLRAAATLGVAFELEVVAELLDLPVDEARRRAERAARGRLLVADAARWSFSNDLVQEILYRSTPEPTRAARHARAAAILQDRPEAKARHARAAGDWPRAMASWLEAADAAARRYANRDAEEMLGEALHAAAAAGDPVGTARARLTRARVREALADYAGALADLEAAAELGRAHARPDLEAAALRALGGDVLVGLGRPSTDCLPYLEVGLDVAEGARLGTLEVELLGRIAVVWSNRARFDLATDAAERALARARELGEGRAVALALDAVKNVSAYLGDVDRLRLVLPELEGLLRAEGDLGLLQWCVFESLVPALAEARWKAADLVLERALALNRRTGHPWGSMFLAQRSWLHRAQGDYGRAIDVAREAARPQATAQHPWWISFSKTMLGWVLSDAGRQEEAIPALEEGVAAAERDGMEAYLARCVSQLALALWRRGGADEAARDLRRAERLLGAVRTPPERAFLHGAHAYAAVARLRLGEGDAAGAERALAPLRLAAERVGWREVVATDRILRGRARLLTGDLAEARRLLAEAVRTAEAAGLVPLAWEGRTALALVAARTGEDAAVEERAASAHLERILRSLDPPRRDALRSFAARRAALAAGEGRS